MSPTEENKTDSAGSGKKKVSEKKTALHAQGKVRITGNYQIPSDLFKYIPNESASLYKMVPLAMHDGVLYVGATNPKDLDARDALNFITTNQKIDYEIQKITEDQFSSLIQQYGQANMEIASALEELEEQGNVILGIDDGDQDTETGEDTPLKEAPVIKLVSNVLAQAVSKEVSDVHIEPLEDRAVVRYRVDGVLQEELRFPRELHSPLVARIKILSSLRLDERRRPQDGRFSSIVQGRRIDFRVATFSTEFGEKVTLRVLDKQKGLRQLEDLGFGEEMYEKVLQAMNRPYGLILATGPTGAGKTTTLYALLNTVERTTKNIVSLEDPVEYRLDGVNQSSIRPEIGYTFANGLRSVLRGDPDQILVGEIRDKETAHLAVQAALTGHLVYSTLHTNTAIGAISRLIDFGIDPFLLAPTIALVIGQRMVRLLDGEGREKPVGPALAKRLEERFADLPQRYKTGIPSFTSFRDAAQTEDNPSGMRGRIGVFEVLMIDDEISEIILKGPSDVEFYRSARKNGFITMSEDAIIKGLKGQIPFSEIMKIGGEDMVSKLSLEDVETELPQVTA
ncbi:MAG: GspE/PulE family protein [Candidatus Kaiserbacteria bacterium]|nr:GspE/PulE family protein [Candidatus Kaiserbacteria bacterium]